MNQEQQHLRSQSWEGFSTGIVPIRAGRVRRDRGPSIPASGTAWHPAAAGQRLATGYLSPTPRDSNIGTGSAFLSLNPPGLSHVVPKNWVREGLCGLDKLSC